MSAPRDDGNAWLMEGGGTPWARFPTLDSTVGGEVLTLPVKRQRTDFDDNTPLIWPNGDPQMEVVVHVATNERRPDVENDDGTRAFHMHGKMLAAVRDAVKATGAPGIFPGGYLYVAWTYEEPSKNPKAKPIKGYAAQYTPPNAGNQALMDGGPPAGQAAAVSAPLAAAPQVAQPTAFVAPQPQAASTPAPAFAQQQSVPTPQGYELIPPCPPGVDSAKWQVMTPDQRVTVGAALAAQGSSPAQAAPAGTPQAATSPPF